MPELRRQRTIDVQTILTHRPPEPEPERRFCAECGTRLNRHHRGRYCYAHDYLDPHWRIKR